MGIFEHHADDVEYAIAFTNGRSVAQILVEFDPDGIAVRLGRSVSPLSEREILKHIGGVPIRRLHLEDLTLSPTVVAAVSEIKTLRLLDIRECGIGDEDVRVLSDKGLPIHIFYLQECDITDRACEYVRRFPRLQGLYLNCRHITDSGVKSLSVIDAIDGLSLEGTSISDELFRTAPWCLRLRRLYLDNTQLSDDGLDTLTAELRLVDLSLSGTRITDRGLVQLANCCTLEKLALLRTAVTPAGLNVFRKWPHRLKVYLSGHSAEDVRWELGNLEVVEFCKST